MSQATGSLDILEIATPCPAEWANMRGDDRVRHCEQCRLNVYNISDMSQREALELIQSHEGRLCVRMWRRADGTVLTRDCPVGLRELRRRVNNMVVATIAFVVGLVFTNVGLGNLVAGASGPSRVGTMLHGLLHEEQQGMPGPTMLMGAICLPPPAGIAEVEIGEGAPVEASEAILPAE